MTEEQLKRLEEENRRLRAKLERYEEIQARHRRMRRSFWQIAARFFAGKSLRDSITRLVEELYSERKVNKDTLGEAVYAVLSRITRLGFITLFLAMTPMLLAGLQTYYLKKQNEKIDYQNRRIEQQTYLQEAERRSSLVFLFDNVLDKIDEELKRNPGGARTLSPQLVGRIVALSKALKPYKYLENDSITARYTSPERGQLLLSLMASKLHPATLDQIFALADFSYADLQDVNLDGAYLRKIKLHHSTLIRLSIVGADLTDADLSHSEMNGLRAFTSGPKPRGARFDHTNFFHTTILNSDFGMGQFDYANFAKCHLKRVYFHQSKMSETRFIDVVADSLDFSNATLLNTTFQPDSSQTQPPVLRLHDAVVDSATYNQFLRLPNLQLRSAQNKPYSIVKLDTPYIDDRGKPFVVEMRLPVIQLKY